MLNVQTFHVLFKMDAPQKIISTCQSPAHVIGYMNLVALVKPLVWQRFVEIAYIILFMTPGCISYHECTWSEFVCQKNSILTTYSCIATSVGTTSEWVILIPVGWKLPGKDVVSVGTAQYLYCFFCKVFYSISHHNFS